MPGDSPLDELTTTAHDLLVVGGGIHGVWAAWDATLRGLSVAIIDRAEFGSGTSANSLRIIHGGLRYLARGDFARMRESIRERATLLRVAPRFVTPLPILLPTYRHRSTPRLLLGTTLLLNDLLSYHQRGPAGHAIPNGRILSASECRTLFPAVNPDGLTGAALWHDGRLLDPQGLVRAIADAAQQQGAAVASHVRADKLLQENGRVHGVHATDCRTGNMCDIRARATLITAGPWSWALAKSQPVLVDYHSPEGQVFAINVLLRRQLAKVGIGLFGVDRYFFLVPDGESTLAGTWYTFPNGTDERTLVANGAAALLRELSAACPAARFSPDDIIVPQAGWLRMGKKVSNPAASLADRPRIVELSDAGGPAGAVLVEGVKFTTARQVAERAVDRITAMLGASGNRCRTAEIVL